MKDPTEGTVSVLFGESFNLRLLIHYVGDIHQPMHAVNRYTPEFPDGDAGGNLFNVTYSQTIHELHGLWDSGIGKYGFNFTLVNI